MNGIKYDGYIGVNFKIPKDLNRDILIVAASIGISSSEAIRRAIAEYCVKHQGVLTLTKLTLDELAKKESRSDSQQSERQ